MHVCYFQTPFSPENSNHCRTGDLEGQSANTSVEGEREALSASRSVGALRFASLNLTFNRLKSTLVRRLWVKFSVDCNWLW